MSNEQKLREALQAVIAAHDACMRELGEQMRTANLTNIRIEGQAVIDAFAAIEQARQALATTAPAVNQQLTTELDEREAFEKWAAPNRFDVGHKGEDGSYLGRATSIAWAGWQARAAMAEGVK